MWRIKATVSREPLSLISSRSSNCLFVFSVPLQQQQPLPAFIDGLSLIVETNDKADILARPYAPVYNSGLSSAVNAYLGIIGIHRGRNNRGP